MNFKPILEKKESAVSVPCRIDLGGTLDISTFFLPLTHLNPGTFNIALDLRTTVTLFPWKTGHIKISSRGFDTAEFEAEKAPFNHPMGLMFAVVRFFNGHGVHVHINSSSPPRSALGGSSAAAVAMVAAFTHALERTVAPGSTAAVAHHIESSVAGVPCGQQDQLAAAFGGVNQWHWTVAKGAPAFVREPLFPHDPALSNLNKHITMAYCGIPHVSSDINKRWVNQFLSGQNRDKWEQIVKITADFSHAVKMQDFHRAALLMNRETHIRLDMTPDVLDDTGQELFKAAEAMGCGARFTGAGGGGCLWAIGSASDMDKLKPQWQHILRNKDQAHLLKAAVDPKGIMII
ncbi:D-glycero-alpha-D-manno-heptose-7-phosphate kinase [Desulfocicer vacuolatum DSM 3385]|uniref:D-glycero-alpha-D-manno-heptose-7-phosphate kinase n=1 Tax=Desulfocicer vacuolatum DSM 3385 TaxID=1121400 RepID=A0A1W2BHB6_9BACT|nr:galactokinase [Desulfocicer vacuolatum]SMC71828.1 D-glycero-alpha-D-manno-heptose-7-phosphate kinase [Desulfocicer vacuolatum DSM 3385]